ncbi:MAG TPA: D-alanine--D-alanine ligase family protein [Candidatus Binataceae bacterium]|nr:D-alanine--D-alanine ligase family protein [Candidatus Binataceae bacterium]
MPSSKRLRVGVLFGGRSGEHEISLRSALTVMSAMDPKRYEVVPIGIGRDGRWRLEHDALRMLAEKTSRLAALNSGGPEVTILPHPNSRAVVPASARESSGLHRSLDVVFPVLHGSYGEDGTVQGLLELAGIPYVGAGVLGSAVGMDKDVQKRILRDAGIPVVRFATIQRTDFREHPATAARAAKELGYPVFVKPAAMGSSIGISKVKRAADLKAALDDAFQYDRKALIEASCEGRELECAVLGTERPEASIVGEILIKGKHEFYSYESKYIDPEGAVTKIPADIPKIASAKIRKIAVAAFKALELRGMARVDFLALSDLSEIYLNEVNTIPGFTSISMYPKLWEATGLPLPKLIDRLIELAIEEHRTRSGLKIAYHSGG